MLFVILVLVVGYLASAALIAGMVYADLQAAYPPSAARDRRSHAGLAVGLGLIGGVYGPFAVLVFFCLTGFAEHGVRFPLSLKRETQR